MLIVEGEQRRRRAGGLGRVPRKALAPAARGRRRPASAKTDSYVAPELISDLELGNKVLGDYRAVILAGVGADRRRRRRTSCERSSSSGGTLMLFMGEPVNARQLQRQCCCRAKLIPGPLTKRDAAVGTIRRASVRLQPQAACLHPLLRLRDQENTGLDTARCSPTGRSMCRRDGNVQTCWIIRPPKARRPRRDRGRQCAERPRDHVHSLGEGRVVFCLDHRQRRVDDASRQARVRRADARAARRQRQHRRRVDEPRRSASAGRPADVKLTAAPTLLDPAQKPIVVRAVAAPRAAATSIAAAPLDAAGRLHACRPATGDVPIAVNVPAEKPTCRTIDDAAIKQALGDIDVDAAKATELPADGVAAATRQRFRLDVMLVVLVLRRRRNVSWRCGLGIIDGRTSGRVLQLMSNTATACRRTSRTKRSIRDVSQSPWPSSLSASGRWGAPSGLHRDARNPPRPRRGFLSREGELSVQFNPQWPWQRVVGAALWNFAAGGVGGRAGDLRLPPRRPLARGAHHARRHPRRCCSRS